MLFGISLRLHPKGQGGMGEVGDGRRKEDDGCICTLSFLPRQSSIESPYPPPSTLEAHLTAHLASTAALFALSNPPFCLVAPPAATASIKSPDRLPAPLYTSLMKPPAVIESPQSPPIDHPRLGGQEGQLLRATKDVYRKETMNRKKWRNDGANVAER